MKRLRRRPSINGTVSSLLGIADNLVSLVTLGVWIPKWQLKFLYRCWNR
jgi:hypothetical protein